MLQALVDKLSKKKEGEGASAAAANPAGFRRLAALNHPEWPVGALGLLCALAVGLQVGAYRCARAGAAAASMYSFHVQWIMHSCGCWVCWQRGQGMRPLRSTALSLASLARPQMPGFSLALSEVVSDLWLPNPDDVR